jgi:ADP-ribosyl-[dinitrogen reductase] hydrolase
VGDALGAPVEFMSLREIRARFGPGGVRDLAPAYGRTGAITDDTQMTLFTAEGLLRLHNLGVAGAPAAAAEVVHRAYLRWLRTQEEPAPPHGATAQGWLLGVPELHHRRSPGGTCLSALRSGRLGTRRSPLNDSKGCGGVMRIAPVGLAFARPFTTACDIAALTHGHASGWLAAGAMAALLAALRDGMGLRDATNAALTALSTEPQQFETAGAIGAALALAGSGPVTPERLETLGRGWVAEEAIAIALAAALAAEGFADGVLRAVNHSGDSDSTGSLAGQILGTLLGEEAIPPAWLEALELRDVVETLADDVFDAFGDPSSPPASVHADRYPPS